MEKTKGKTSVSFPVTVAYVSETGAIQLIRRTDPTFEAEISPGPCYQTRHEALYASLREALAEGGVAIEPEARDPRWN